MATITCPHCGVANPSDAQFCESCGKAQPSASASGPRVLAGPEFAATDTGQALQAEELHKQAKSAAGALLAVAILQTLFGTFVVMAPGLFAEMVEVEVEVGAAVYLVVYGIAVVFFGLYFWARKNPVPAAVAGLVVFLTVHLLDALADPSALIRGILVKVIIIVVLVKAIKAGARHRQLTRQIQAP